MAGASSGAAPAGSRVIVCLGITQGGRFLIAVEQVRPPVGNSHLLTEQAGTMRHPGFARPLLLAALCAGVVVLPDLANSCHFPERNPGTHGARLDTPGLRRGLSQPGHPELTYSTDPRYV